MRGRRSWVEVSRGRIQANFRAARALAGGAEVCAVVKADAYGHGAVEVSRTVAAEGGRWLAVSGAEEGAALREAGIEGVRILVMADSVVASGRTMAEFGLTPVIHELGEIAVWAAMGSSLERRLEYHLKVDSGMGRLGTRAASPEVARAVAGGSPWARMEGLMTHFASAADYMGSQTEAQAAAFEAVRAVLRAEPEFVHLEATSAFAYGRSARAGVGQTMVRLGHSIYGYVSPVRVRPNEPAPENLLQVRPALTWKASLLAVKELEAGAPVGYGAMFRTDRPMRIGIVATGYADGIPHRLGNRGRVIAGGEWAPILGAVSMDVTTIDLTRAPELGPGDAVTILGKEGGCFQDAQQLARVAGTISYRILCGIGPRVSRVWVD
ncbi:MAG: alanine racemase [Bryobacteraceae bacterium]